MGKKPPRTIAPRRFHADQVAWLAGVPAARVANWVRLGLIQPLESVGGEPRFDFAQVAAAQRLKNRDGFLAGVCRAATQWTPTRVAALFAEALECESLGRWNAASRRYRQAIRLSPDDPAIRFNHGNVRMAQGRYEQAIARYEETLALDPLLFAAWNNLGLAQLRAGRPSDAIAAFRRAVALAPLYAPARRNLALARRRAIAVDSPVARAG